MKALIEPTELLALKNNTALVLLDVRTGTDVHAHYAHQHLAHAIFVDLETALAHKTADPAQGGRHPLPAVEDFAKLLGEWGIDAHSHVVIYDDKNGSNAAARCWWMLRSAGHAHTQVINGGLQAALAAGYPTRSGNEKATAKPAYPVTEWLWPVVNMQTVEKAAADKNFVVIDVRDAIRYRGEKEPIDLVAGHIPGAINVPFSENLDENGFFLSAETLKEKYTNILNHHDAAHTIVHCGSGVTACHTLLAMAHAGLPVPKLYVGSWSEWSRNGKEIGKK